MTDYQIRALGEADDESARAAWNTVFALGQGASERTREEWNWAYAKNPAGRRAFVALADARVVALYAALPVTALVEGTERTFAQIVDSLVLREHRTGLKRPGLFVEVGRKFFERFGGRDAFGEGDAVFFGWPVEAAWRSGERHLAYGTLRAEILLGCDPRSFQHGIGVEVPEGVERLTRFDQQSRWLYDRCCGPWGASTIRDARWLTWRYLERPGAEYYVFGVRDREGILRGMAVQRTCAFLGPRTSVLVDWLVPEDEHQVAELLLSAVLARSRADDTPAVCTLVPPWSPWFAWFQEHGFAAHASDYVLSARSFSAQHDLDWLRERWWYQLGDSDLV